MLYTYDETRALVGPWGEQQNQLEKHWDQKDIDAGVKINSLSFTIRKKEPISIEPQPRGIYIFSIIIAITFDVVVFRTNRIHRRTFLSEGFFYLIMYKQKS
mmetsp:Transcript_16972/g.35447  ORF Transcript_16972/g.35447 Transcript_16972/m.35447 type:complete len:101 (+) Transcript_16972:2277-2579(+)